MGGYRRQETGDRRRQSLGKWIGVGRLSRKRVGVRCVVALPWALTHARVRGGKDGSARENLKNHHAVPCAPGFSTLLAFHHCQVSPRSKPADLITWVDSPHADAWRFGGRNPGTPKSSKPVDVITWVDSPHADAWRLGVHTAGAPKRDQGRAGTAPPFPVSPVSFLNLP